MLGRLVVIEFALLGAAIYVFVILIRFIHLGIKAFSIYIEKNKNS